MATVIKLKIKCTDDNTEWEVVMDDAKVQELRLHTLKLEDPQGTKGAFAAWMECSQCQKNHDHILTKTVEE